MSDLIKRYIAIMIAIMILPISFNIEPMISHAVTVDDLASYIEGLVGTSAKEWGGGSGTQCVELPKYYVEDYFGVACKNEGLGNGNTLYRGVASLAPDKFDAIDYYDGFTPQPGDIISYHSSTSPSAGHAALVYSVSGNTYTIAEQWKGSGTVRSNTKTVRGPEYGVSYTIIGVARPKAGPKPEMQIPYISFDKSTYNIGETVNVSWTPSPPGSDCGHYWIAIWNPAGENIVNEDPYGTSYSFTVDREGTYRVWTAATPYWSTEGEDSLTDEKTFEVATPIPSGPILSEGAGQTLPDGDYFIFSNLNSKSFLDIVGTDIPAAAGTNVTMYNFGKEDYPREVHACDAWTLQYLNNGFYKIKQKSTGMCLDVQGASQQRGTNVQVWTEHDGAAQQWSIAATDNGYTIRARCGGYYLDMHNAETADGTNVQLWDLDDGKHQRWGFVPFAPSIGQTIEDGTYTIQSAVNSEYCLDVHGRDGNAYTKETNVWLWPINDCNDTFNVKYLGDGYYSICEAVSGLALDIVDKGAEGYLNVGNNIQVFTNNQTANQKWIIRDAGDGYYNIISAYSGYSLDLSGGIAENGRNIAQYYYNTSNAQKWKFISPIEAPKSAMLKSDKKSAIVGETITFTADSDTATAYWIGIDKDRERIITEEMKDGTLSISFDEAGEYTAYVTASNVMGGVDSAKIEFNVKLDIILHVNEIYELPFSDNRYTYKSHNTNIATVTKNGVITALKEGTTILSVVTEDSEVIQYTLKVVEQNIEGDCNADGEFNIADVVLLQEWLLAVPDTHLANWQAANLCEDDRLDVFDLCLMKRKLING